MPRDSPSPAPPVDWPSLLERLRAMEAAGTLNDESLASTCLAHGLRDGGEHATPLRWPGMADDLQPRPPDDGDSLSLDAAYDAGPGQPGRSSNRLIVGDNLPVMRLLARDEGAFVNLAYLDPPYNTGRQFTFDDRFASTGEDALPPRARWLRFMAPRLVAIRELMRPEGVVAIHIDEHEHASLVLLCQQIFGAQSYLGSMVWDKGNPKGDARHLAHQHELIVLVARDVRRCPPMRRPKENGQRLLDAARRALDEAPDLDSARGVFDRWVRAAEGLSGGERMYRRLSDDGRVYRLVSMAWPNKRRAPDPYFEPLIHPVTGLPCPVPARGWRNPPATMRALRSDDLIEFGRDHSTQPQRRYFLDEHLLEPIPSVLRFAGADDRRLAALGIPFEHPKPLELATRLVQWFCPPEGAVLDVFAGSGTTGHATWLANERDGGRRRFTLAQLDEPIQGAAAREFERVDQVTSRRLQAAARTLDPWPNGRGPREASCRQFERHLLVRPSREPSER